MESQVIMDDQERCYKMYNMYKVSKLKYCFNMEFPFQI